MEVLQKVASQPQDIVSLLPFQEIENEDECLKQIVTHNKSNNLARMDLLKLSMASLVKEGSNYHITDDWSFKKRD